MAKHNASKSLHGVRELRSVNVQMDIDYPERLVGYTPTSKSLSLADQVFQSLLGRSSEKAYVVSAPYGSGKSSAGLFWCLLAESRITPNPHVRSVLKHLDRSGKELGKGVRDYINDGRKSIAVPIHGSLGSVGETLVTALSKALNRNGFRALAKKVAASSHNAEGVLKAFDLIETDLGSANTGLLILWDEFGKLLEQASALSDSRPLFEIQAIAERCARSPKVSPIVLVMLLHQNFSQYASTLPGYVKAEWSKIEGRFKQVSYIEDSKEIYELIGEILDTSGIIPSQEAQRSARACQSIGLFKDFNRDSLADLIQRTAVLAPVTLYLLPLISARVGQNERTLFEYLRSIRVSRGREGSLAQLSPADVFEYFSDLMRRDTGPGGSYRFWAASKQALERTADKLDQILIKTVACIGLAKANTTICANVPTIALAVGSTEEKVRAKLEALAEQKVLSFQRLLQEYSLWSGNAADVRSAIQERKQRCEQSLNVRDFLRTELPPPPQFPQRHNDRQSIRRYFDACYVDAGEIEKTIAGHLLASPPRDGRIYCVLAETRMELEHALNEAARVRDENVILLLPRKPLGIRSTAAELKACHELLLEPEFSGSQAGSGGELRQLTDECEAYLVRQLEPVLNPSQQTRIFHQGKEVIGIESRGAFNRYLSAICDRRFPKTPVFRSELINKSEVPSTIINARKKLVRAILSSNGTENLGLLGYGPEVSIFRAVLLTTGIYQRRKKTWVLSAPEQVEDPAIREVWSSVLEFWTKPSDSPKDATTLFEKLTLPPFGMRAAVLPILLAAGLRYATNPITILEDDVYITELRAEFFERLLKTPSRFKIQIPTIDASTAEYLSAVAKLFGGGAQEHDSVRRAVSAVMTWARDLPPAALASGMISDEVDQFVSILKAARDPSKLLLQDFLSLARTKNAKGALNWVAARKGEMESIEEQLLSKCRSAVFTALGASETAELQSILIGWKAALPGVLDQYFGSQTSAGFLTRVGQSYESEPHLLQSLAELFSGKSVKHWDSSTFALFQASLASTVKSIESTAEMLDFESHRSGKKKAGFPWMERRLRGHIQAISSRIGLDETREFLNRLLREVEADHE